MKFISIALILIFMLSPTPHKLKIIQKFCEINFILCIYLYNIFLGIIKNKL